MRVTVLAVALVVPLSGCGVVGMIASGVSDGTKYVINRFEEGQQVQAAAPALEPEPAAPSAGYGADQGAPPAPAPAPAPLTAPVTPVTKGVPVK